jgi:glucoside 3-dehydrogenase (cytochrome c) hitch-hiker subunit
VAKAYQYRFFSPHQLQTLDALGETIIPKDDHSGGAKAAHVSEYIDAIVADDPETTKQLWREGLTSVERHSHAKFQKAYASCSSSEQSEILRAVAGPDEQDPFFKALKRATVDGYYTSPVGIFEDLEYHGNQALPAFPGCQLPEIKSEYS